MRIGENMAGSTHLGHRGADGMEFFWNLSKFIDFCGVSYFYFHLIDLMTFVCLAFHCLQLITQLRM